MAALGNYREYSEYLSLGAEITAGMLVPIGAGYLVDYYWQTEPWGVLIGMLVGFFQVFNIIIKLVRRSTKKEGKGPSKNHKNTSRK